MFGMVLMPELHMAQLRGFHGITSFTARFWYGRPATDRMRPSIKLEKNCIVDPGSLKQLGYMRFSLVN
jgi:hypothetical protein